MALFVQDQVDGVPPVTGITAPNVPVVVWLRAGRAGASQRARIARPNFMTSRHLTHQGFTGFSLWDAVDL